MMSALDDSIGNITKALSARGMLENTVIAFSTDNGGPAAGFDYNMACNWPLRYNELYNPHSVYEACLTGIKKAGIYTYICGLEFSHIIACRWSVKSGFMVTQKIQSATYIYLYISA